MFHVSSVERCLGGLPNLSLTKKIMEGGLHHSHDQLACKLSVGSGIGGMVSNPVRQIRTVHFETRRLSDRVAILE
jgi:hypothetical protein